MPSSVPTPYAVRCYYHGKVYLTSEEYNFQMNRPDRLWECPTCRDNAEWDDDNYEKYYNFEDE